MPQSLAQVWLHLVFSTKNRENFLVDPEVRRDVHSYLAGVCKALGCPPVCVGGVADHVHLLCGLGRTCTIAELVQGLKLESSKVIKLKSPKLANFYWQNGYGAFSVSPSHLDDLVKYIQNQVEHHRTESFQHEFRRLLKKYGLSWDERYVWD
jgi:putative transposase